MSREIASEFVDVEGVKLHYLSAGEGEPVLLLHGWPTSSFLWRNMIEPIAAGNRVIALDLPGFGQSDKPLDVSYSFRYYDRILEGFLDALGIETTSLAVHDLGGPIGLYWACQHPEKVQRLALLNTMVYPGPSWAVILFIAVIKLPGCRSLLTSRWGLKMAMRLGVADSRRITAEVIDGVWAPYRTAAARKALLKAGQGLVPKGFQEIAKKLPSLKVSVRVIYGERDHFLPDVAQTMERVQRDFPQAQVTPLADCGHFLQEDKPDEIGQMLAEFFGPTSSVE